MPEYFPTQHAARVMSERDMAWAEVLWVLEAPEVSYTQTHRAAGSGNRIVHQRGDIYVVTSTNPTFDRLDTEKATPLLPVITIGLRQDKQWTDEEARNRKAQP